MVIDASVWVSYLAPADVNHAASRRWLAQQMRDGRLLIGPVLLLAEVGGAIARTTGRSELGQRTIEHLLALPGLRLVPVDHALGLQAARLAAAHRLRGADAVYVAVAAELGLPLVSWDIQQRERAAAVVPARQPA